ncbi:hypothetical protein DM01DRAFT_1408313 [Hesseltinella vesiculosa]|uniref:Uncharacterized protein n=1 Tax=Hesseltinella vesiculosa TaxID=101127 RepID=A0A1X2GFC7_9FUNG|nr:hypothetical protein DM01DRAFT_1408313 [Hesseltinella vesiculosa]
MNIVAGFSLAARQEHHNYAHHPLTLTDPMLHEIIDPKTSRKRSPIMPVETCSFTLKPFGFFNKSPAVDVPRATIRYNTFVNTDESGNSIKNECCR